MLKLVKMNIALKFFAIIVAALNHKNPCPLALREASLFFILFFLFPFFFLHRNPTLSVVWLKTQPMEKPS